ncbi:L-serine ammonia-lyase [Piscinibacter sakaiensis]|uniref:L-serine ammonia-lyase n=1 Tax=Piscinibacter sakaiensis TaxID=1547922 RepID=A0A0K8P491_PISS1|nr:L-serine ammonia-lyase [Piscinibacter sakaiensis]GAP37416.1 L-serine dehydratase [Piscinibacter sakaiensis]
MAVSVFDLFKIGIGPSSSHTVGPMRAARLFVGRLAHAGRLAAVARLRCELYGSLGATGKGHGSDKAVLLGLAGHEPDSVDPDAVPALLGGIRSTRRVSLGGPDGPSVALDEKTDLVFHRRQRLPFHTNALRFVAFDAAGTELDNRCYYSVGGGFVVSEEVAADGSRQARIAPDATALPWPFRSGAELLAITAREGCSIADVMRRNERHWRDDAATEAGLLRIWDAMQACVQRGLRTDGVLPGGFQVRRRAAALHRQLCAHPEAALRDPLQVLDWVNLYALAVNEENAAGGRVVTAPTNGAAGIVPAVLHYYARFVAADGGAPRSGPALPGAAARQLPGAVPGTDSGLGPVERGVVDFLLTAAAIGLLYKENASISGAEVGCQGEVGVACSMAAGALCAVMGGSPAQVENAAEIGMEHHLGLTCDPVGGLVQIPCIERNAIASVKAINAARMALRGDGSHHVSLDQVIKTMRETGADMMSKYKETARGGLAVNIVEC